MTAHVIRAYVGEQQFGLRQGRLVPFDQATVHKSSEAAVEVARSYAKKCAKRRMLPPVLVVEPK